MAISRIERIDGRDGVYLEMFSPVKNFPPNDTIILRESREHVFFRRIGYNLCVLLFSPAVRVFLTEN